MNFITLFLIDLRGETVRYIDRRLIERGFSGDKKYRVTAKNGAYYLLRVSPFSQYRARKADFSLMQTAAKLDINMCRPLKFGVCREGVYSLQTWIDGDDVEDVISLFTDAEQYSYGLDAGKMLQKIHTIPAPDTCEEWESRFNRKMDRKIEMYTECPLKYENGDLFIQYINENRRLIKNRPQSYQHGDYHIGNMMIDRVGNLQIIDFNRHDYGDPWEEFNRIVWAAQVSPNFAAGMVNGYFDNNVPIDFWRLLALYISSNTLSSLPWGIPFGDEKIKIFQKQAQDILRWYDNMKNVVPMWYTAFSPYI